MQEIDKKMLLFDLQLKNRILEKDPTLLTEVDAILMRVEEIGLDGMVIRRLDTSMDFSTYSKIYADGKHDSAIIDLLDSVVFKIKKRRVLELYKNIVNVGEITSPSELTSFIDMIEKKNLMITEDRSIEAEVKSLNYILYKAITDKAITLDDAALTERTINMVHAIGVLK